MIIFTAITSLLSLIRSSVSGISFIKTSSVISAAPAALGVPPAFLSPGFVPPLSPPPACGFVLLITASAAALRRQLSVFILFPHLLLKSVNPLDLRVLLLKYHSPLLLPAKRSRGGWLLLLNGERSPPPPALPSSL